jgi:hypothetical protein
MKKSITAGLILASLFILTTFTLTFVPNAGAQSVTIKWKTFSYINKAEGNLYGGDKNRLVGIFTRRGLSVYENGEVALVSSWGTFDNEITKRVGKSEVFNLYTFEDGSTIMAKYNMKAILSPKDSKHKFEFSGEFTDGTGRFKGIKGNLSGSGKQYTPVAGDTKGEAYFEVMGTYTLPPK